MFGQERYSCDNELLFMFLFWNTDMGYKRYKFKIKKKKIIFNLNSNNICKDKDR